MGAKSTTASFINKALNIHKDKYTYNKVNYMGAMVKVEITCRIHGDFKQTPNEHLSGKGCRQCKMDVISLANSARATLRKNWNFEQPEDYKLIPLTRGKFAKVSNEDFDKVKMHNWYLNSGGYAVNKKVGYMHRFVTNAEENSLVDHKDRDRTNNIRSNLKFTDSVGNAWNTGGKTSTSSYKGVHFLKTRKNKPWVSSIMCKGIVYRIGTFKTEEECAKAYDIKALELRGDSTYLNFPELKESYLKEIKSSRRSLRLNVNKKNVI